MDARANRFMELFSPTGRERLMGHLVYQEAAAGEFLFEEGDPGTGIYLVLEGEVEILKRAGTRELVIATMGADDFFGEVTVLDGHGRIGAARARIPSSLALVPIDSLLSVLDGEPVAVTMQLFQRVLYHLRNSNNSYVQEVLRKERLMVVGEMAATLMHDLRNPMQVILSCTDIIRMSHDDESTVGCCERIRVQCDRLVTMAGDLLEFSKGESKLHLTRTDTTKLLTDFAMMNENLVRNPTLKLVIEEEPAEIEVDTTRLLRALQNLLNNAVEAVKDQPTPMVNVQAWVSDSVLYLSVIDNGPGLPDYVKEHLFEPFITKGKKNGTGLGMAIVHSVITAHRGTITFESSPEEGTRFLASIPQDSNSPSLI